MDDELPPLSGDDGSGRRAGVLTKVRENSLASYCSVLLRSCADHLVATLCHSFIGLEFKILGYDSARFKNHPVSPSRKDESSPGITIHKAVSIKNFHPHCQIVASHSSRTSFEAS
ncbi:MAG: hypothetical protein WCF81_22670 [Roseiarcus sp.]